ncbi:hypothetical protein EVAR_38522_1 [Eumeta japonica]|uniref:Uncharacterized protein n=1 Tax=Eumeta variegata TaxID=151549 RepID=A0A4C1WDJ8_EUMVA|nr:hypothetical protein EVAR_38522_1 [Eumeta japonica]
MQQRKLLLNVCILCECDTSRRSSRPILVTVCLYHVAYRNCGYSMAPFTPSAARYLPPFVVSRDSPFAAAASKAPRPVALRVRSVAAPKMLWERGAAACVTWPHLNF